MDNSSQKKTVDLAASAVAVGRRAPTVVAIVPARAGSKGIPRKNSKPFGGIPLIARAVQGAVAAHRVTRVIVSTDDDEMLQLAVDAGAEAPFKRPPHLATDTARTVDVIAHMLDFLRDSGEEPDMFVMLQATSPFRTSADIDGGIEALWNSHEHEALVSVCEAAHHPMKMHKIEDGSLKPFVHNPYGTVNRKELPTAYQENGSLYIQTVASFRKNMDAFYCGLKSNKIMPYLMPAESSVDLDTQLDWVMGEMLLRFREKDSVSLKNKPENETEADNVLVSNETKQSTLPASLEKNSRSVV